MPFNFHAWEDSFALREAPAIAAGPTCLRLRFFAAKRPSRRIPLYLPQPLQAVRRRKKSFNNALREAALR